MIVVMVIGRTDGNVGMLVMSVAMEAVTILLWLLQP